MSKKSKRNASALSFVLTLVAIVIILVSRLTGIDDTGKPVALNTLDNKTLVVHYLDVGQGDSEFIELPNGEYMLIDASEKGYSNEIIEAIEGYGCSKLDYVVATHPHSDHIGGLSEVINHFDIGEIYMPKAVSTSKTYERLLTAVSDKNLQINTAKAGKSIYSSDELKIDIIAPIHDAYDDINNYSVVIKISYGSNSFLFTGDAEALVENELLENNYSQLNCDVLKVGHHGSNSSSTLNFLEAVSPTYSVISCGEGNSYGHPHSETLMRLADVGTFVYETDRDGTVTINCDGADNFEVVCEK